ncbi:MAG TPA: DUF4349 domain-containing protein [Gemmataceae bacterium]|jgi:hypothetical protein
MRQFLILFLLLVVAFFLGCGGVQKARLAKEAPPEQKGGGGGAAGGVENKAAPRKIIYTGLIDLIVDEFDGSEGQLLELVQEHEGYLAESDVYNQPGSPRSGMWKVRVPTKQFEAFMQAVAKLGEVRKRTSNSQDITDAYFDRAARLKADEAEEKSLLGLLEKTQGKVEDILKVREQLRIVRGHIEENKGQLQRWDKDVDFATVTIKLLDRRDYTPPLMPDFGSTIGRTFQGSIEALVLFGKGIVLVVVALAPWLVVLALLVVPLWIIWRRWRAANTVIPVAESPGAADRQTGE